MTAGFVIACIIIFVIVFGIIIYCGEFTCESAEEEEITERNSDSTIQTNSDLVNPDPLWVHTADNPQEDLSAELD